MVVVVFSYDSPYWLSPTVFSLWNTCLYVYIFFILLIVYWALRMLLIMTHNAASTLAKIIRKHKIHRVCKTAHEFCYKNVSTHVGSEFAKKWNVSFSKIEYHSLFNFSRKCPLCQASMVRDLFAVWTWQNIIGKSWILCLLTLNW